MKAAIHLGEDYNDNLVVYRNTNFDAFKTLFDKTQLSGNVAPWMISTLLHDKVSKMSKEKNGTGLFRFSLCLGKMHGHPDADKQ